MIKDVGAADQRKDQTVDCAPKMCGVADVIHIPFRHIPAVQQVQRCEYVDRNGDRNQVDVDSHLRFEQDGGEKDG